MKICIGLIVDFLFECNPTCSNPNPLPGCMTMCEIFFKLGVFVMKDIFLVDLFNECILVDKLSTTILCNEETEVELWGECYNIEETTELNYSYVYLGEISPNIGDLINLNYVHISDCGLSGQIPSEIGNLENLVSLQIYDNNLDLPDSLGMDIDSNLTGEIPVEIGNLVNLQQLDLRNNELSGVFPI